MRLNKTGKEGFRGEGEAGGKKQSDMDESRPSVLEKRSLEIVSS